MHCKLKLNSYLAKLTQGFIASLSVGTSLTNNHGFL